LPGGAGKKVLLDGRELKPNQAIPASVWEVWDALPTETLPRRGARPIKRLVWLAQALSADGVRLGALSEVESTMHAILDSLAVRYKGEFEAAMEEVWSVRGLTISGRRKTGKLTYSDFVERADDRAIRVGFEDAKKAFGADVAQSYVNHLASEDSDDDDDGLREAFVKVSGLAIVKPCAKGSTARRTNSPRSGSPSIAWRSRSFATSASRCSRRFGRKRPSHGAANSSGLARVWKTTRSSMKTARSRPPRSQHAT